MTADMYKITVKGDKMALANLRRTRMSFDSIVKSAVRVSGLQVEKQAKLNSPVKTGNLRRSIMSVEENSGMTIRVGPDMRVAPYAEWVELGHSQQPGRYVPAINRRLVASFVNGRFYMQMTFVQMRQRVYNNIKKAIQFAMK